MSPEYLAPSFKVEINGSGLAADISRQIQQVSVTGERNSMDHFSLTVANPYPEMRWTHNEKDVRLFHVGNTVTIMIGYVGEEQPMISGEITLVTAQFPESGTPSLAVQGHTRLHRLDRSSRTRTFQSLTDKQIVEQIAGEYGLTPQVEETGETRTVHPSVVQQNQTDLRFLLERANRIHFELRVEDKTLIFRPAHYTDSPIAFFEWGKSLRSFSPRLSTQGKVNSVTVRGYDPKTKKEIVGRFTSPSAGGQSGPEVTEQAFGSGEEVRERTPVRSQEEADQLAQAIWNDRTRRFLTGSGTMIGLPTLRVGQVIELRGLGLFNGKYRLTTVNHTLDSGGYSTRFDGEWFPG